MNMSKSLVPVLLILLVGATIPAAAQPPSSEPRPELTIVVVDSLKQSDRGNFVYERIARVFTAVFDEQKWPLTTKVERFGDNAAHPIELQVFFQEINDLTFSAWITLNIHGAKTDFGVVRYRCTIRQYDRTDDRLDRVVRGAAEMAAARVGTLLFPNAVHPSSSP